MTIHANAAEQAKEIKRLEREQARPKGPSYFYYLLLIVSIVYIADEVASAIGQQMQSVIAQAIFAPVFGAEMAVARMSALGQLSLLGMVVAIMYKPLSDRYGRKPFLVINTMGMGVGLLIISAAANIPVYLAGYAVIQFFTPHDMQAVYLLESTPARHRAKYYSVVKGISMVGVMLIPLLRRIFMGGGHANWRFVFFVPALIAAAVALVALLSIRETDAFLARRLEYLRMGEAEREAAKKEKSAERAQGGFFAALKFCMRHKQLRWLLIGGGFLMWGWLMTMYYETTMTYGYAAQFLEQGMELERAQVSATPFVTQALFWFPVGCGAFTFIQGFFSDQWGRKPAVIVMSSCAVISFGLFYLGANLHWSPWMVGLCCGAAIGSYWAALDIVGGIMCSESTPTNLRSSVLGVQPMLSAICSLVALGAGLVLINVLGDAYAGIISLGLSIPGILIGLVIIFWKVRETKNADLEALTGREEPITQKG